MSIKLLFSEYFEIKDAVLNDFGALNMCLDADLPLFIDPFLLFASKNAKYQELHQRIIDHLIFLKELALSDKDNVDINLFKFPEIKQNWLGLSKYGNYGRGLGRKFALSSIKAFNSYFSNFGSEALTETSHIEKLTLLGAGIGKDFISDFTTNLILDFLLDFSQDFAMKYLPEHCRKKFSIRCKFNQELRIWIPKTYELPYFYLENDGDFIILTPLDILTKDDSFISHTDLRSNFRGVANSIENVSLRNSINSYFTDQLPRSPKKKQVDIAVEKTIKKFPELLDYYIRIKEIHKEQSHIYSGQKVSQVQKELLSSLRDFSNLVLESSDFFSIKPDSYQEALQRALYLKDVIENNDGYRIFYHDGRPIGSEDTVQRIFRLTWYASPYDVNTEVNNGRGPADYKISFGSGDSTIVEFKLGKSSSIKSNLLHQTEIYKKASKSITDIKVILCYSLSEIRKVERILDTIKQKGAENIIIIDASPKISASKVR